MSADYIIAICALLCTMGTLIFGIYQLRGKAGNDQVESLTKRVERLEAELKIKTTELKIRTEERDNCYKRKDELKAENFKLYQKLSEAGAL